jgi:hypothetical protein
MAQQIEIPTPFYHDNNVDSCTLYTLCYYPVICAVTNNDDELEKILESRNIIFTKDEIMININLKSLIVNAFINNDIEIIDAFIRNGCEYMLTILFALAARYSNINTVHYFTGRGICTFTLRYHCLINSRIIYYAVERTDDDVEILDAIYKERKVNDLTILKDARYKAFLCGNHKMARYLENEITIFNKN